MYSSDFCLKPFSPSRHRTAQHHQPSAIFLPLYTTCFPPLPLYLLYCRVQSLGRASSNWGLLILITTKPWPAKVYPYSTCIRSTGVSVKWDGKWGLARGSSACMLWWWWTAAAPRRDDRIRSAETDVDGWEWVGVCNCRGRETPAALQHNNHASRHLGLRNNPNKPAGRTLLH